MALDLITRKRSPRDWSLGAELTERRVSSREQAPRSALALIPSEFLHEPYNNHLLLERATLAAYTKLKNAAVAAGIPSSLLKIVSGFRSFRAQELLWQKAREKYGSADKARIWVAPPGSSTHATGRAVDLWLGMACDSRNVEALRGSVAYSWLVQNAGKFGFYPYRNEPWHWEYNPTVAEVMKSGLAMPAAGVERETAEAEEGVGKSAGWTGAIMGALLLGAGGAAWYATRKKK